MFNTTNISLQASRILWFACAAAALAFLVRLSAWNYPAFHILAELFSVIVAYAIFVIAWNARDTMDNGYLMFLGIAFLSIASIDLVHMLAYTGTDLAFDYGSDPPTQLWIAARFLEALTLLIAPFFLSHRVWPLTMLAVYVAVVALVLLSIFRWDIFPSCYVDGYGLTATKIVAEYVICGILCLAITVLWINRGRIGRPAQGLLFGMIIVTILSELAFTMYVKVEGNVNMVGHLLKIVAFLLAYKAIVETGFRRPYELVYRSLAESERKFRSVVESNIIGVAFSDLAAGVVSEANDEFLRIAGQSRKELKAGKVAWNVKVLSEEPDAEAEKPDARRVDAAGRSFEKVWMRSDGTRIPVIVGEAFLDDSRRRMVAYVLDNTARKQHEQFVQRAREDAERMAEMLARSNRELEHFSSIVSHDLQEPLRTTSGFLGLLRKRCAATLDEKANLYIAYAIDGVERMSRMIRDLLNYSRIGRQKGNPVPTNTDAVFKQVLANCSASIRESQAVVVCGELPVVCSDQLQLVQLFQNLIANAVKFRRPGVPPEVHVTAAREQDQWLFQIRDNGIGIPKDQISRLFQPFQRLHGAKEYSGTGIGLALCRKIVELHGGRIWIESDPGTGTTVFFTLATGAGPSSVTSQLISETRD